MTTMHGERPQRSPTTLGRLINGVMALIAIEPNITQTALTAPLTIRLCLMIAMTSHTWNSVAIGACPHLRSIVSYMTTANGSGL